jgi:pectinesterase
MRSLPLALLLTTTTLATSVLAQDVHVRVDTHGPGSAASLTDYTSIQQALDHAPDSPTGRIIISIAPGIYHERVAVTRNRPRVTFLGLGKSPEDVVITASENAKSAGGTFLSATTDIEGDSFQADNVTFENAAPEPTSVGGGQAVAIAVRSDRAIFKHCRFLGDQDTLFADYGRQLYLDSYIRGGVDFIFGNATAVFLHDEIHEIRPAYLTAQSRTSPDQTTGYVIDHSTITSHFPVGQVDLGTAQRKSPYNDGVVHIPFPPPLPPRALIAPGRNTFYLGRPWRLYSRVIVMNTELPASLDPAGWSIWHQGDDFPPKAYYAEFHNTGPGAATNARAPWSHQLTAEEAKQYEPTNFLAGSDHWDALAEAAKLP